jgi:NADPH:quinone reductase-like Zn-dependent oxidoreductase
VKAVVHTEYGPPDVLRLAEVPAPVPGEHDLLVRVHASSVNAMDWRLLTASPFLARLHAGLLRPRSGILGADVAGRVEAVGRGVTRFRPGDAVFGDLAYAGRGGFAEYACAREEAWTAKPPGLSFAEAAALPLAGVTALQALRDAGRLRPGQRVLIHGASGGVGTFAVQLARHLGGAVTAVCGPDGVALVRALGAEQVLDYTREDFARGGARFDLIVAVGGDRSILDYKRALAPGGRYVMVGGSDRQLFQALLLGPLAFLAGGRTMAVASAKPSPGDLGELCALVEAGAVRPVIDRRYPLAGVPDAIRYLQAGHPRGKVVIEVAGDEA